MTTFLEALQAQPNPPANVRRVLGMRAGKRKDRILQRLEGHAKVHLGLTSISVDWANPATATKIDWAKLLQFIAKIIPIVLALFGL